MRNVSAPKDHEESQGAPRMLRLQMTDGHTTCVGLEFKHLSKIRYLYKSFGACKVYFKQLDVDFVIVWEANISVYYCKKRHHLYCFKWNNCKKCISSSYIDAGCHQASFS